MITQEADMFIPSQPPQVQVNVGNLTNIVSFGTNSSSQATLVNMIKE